MSRCENCQRNILKGSPVRLLCWRSRNFSIDSMKNVFSFASDHLNSFVLGTIEQSFLPFYLFFSQSLFFTPLAESRHHLGFLSSQDRTHDNFLPAKRNPNFASCFSHLSCRLAPEMFLFAALIRARLKVDTRPQLTSTPRQSIQHESNKATYIRGRRKVI